MEKKSKYTLFPARPLPPPRDPLPPLPEGCLPPDPDEQPAHLQQSPTIPPQDLLPPHPANRPSPAPREASSSPPLGPLTPPAEELPCPWLPRNNSWSSREETTSTLNETPTTVEESSLKRKMHTPSSSTSSESSLHKPVITSSPTNPSNPRNRPRTVYFHSGLGGAGNYHKAIREDNILRPIASNRANHPRFLSSLFGTLGAKRERRQRQQCTGMEETRSSQPGDQVLSLGAAEAIRRKMLGLTSNGKAKESCARS